MTAVRRRVFEGKLGIPHSKVVQGGRPGQVGPSLFSCQIGMIQQGWTLCLGLVGASAADPDSRQQKGRTWGLRSPFDLMPSLLFQRQNYGANVQLAQAPLNGLIDDLVR